MDPTNPSFWERLGFPLATLILLGIVAFRVVSWCRPWVEKLVQGHLTFLARTETMIEAQADSIERLSHDMAQSRAETAKMASDIVSRLDRLIEKSGH